MVHRGYSLIHFLTHQVPQLRLMNRLKEPLKIWGSVSGTRLFDLRIRHTSGKMGHLHYGPSMMSHRKTPWKDPEGVLQILWVCSMAFLTWNDPSEAVNNPRGLSKGSFTVTLTVHSVHHEYVLIEPNKLKHISRSLKLLVILTSRVLTGPYSTFSSRLYENQFQFSTDNVSKLSL